MGISYSSIRYCSCSVCQWRLIAIPYDGDQYDIVLAALVIPYDGDRSNTILAASIDGDQYDDVLVALVISYDRDQYNTCSSNAYRSRRRSLTIPAVCIN